jgi:hypothetical protein
MSFLVPEFTVGTNILDADGAKTEILKHSILSSQNAPLPIDLGNLLVRMGFATPQNGTGKTYHFSLSPTVIFHQTEHKLHSPDVSRLRLIPHIALIDDNQNSTTGRYAINQSKQQITALRLYGGHFLNNYDATEPGLRQRTLPENFIKVACFTDTIFGIFPERIFPTTVRPPDRRDGRICQFLYPDTATFQVDGRSRNGQYEIYSIVYPTQSGKCVLTRHILTVPAREATRATAGSSILQLIDDPQRQRQLWASEMATKINQLIRRLENNEGRHITPSFADRVRSFIRKSDFNGKVPRNSRFRLLILVKGGLWGETQIGMSMLHAAQERNWECALINNPHECIPLISALNPHLVFSMDPTIELPDCICVVTIQGTNSSNAETDVALRAIGNNDGFVFWLFGDALKKGKERLAHHLQVRGRKMLSFDFVPSSHRTAFCEYPRDRQRMLFCTGGNWDQLRKSSTYASLYRRLGGSGFCKFYGEQSVWGEYQGYDGRLILDGQSPIEKARECGISLILHGSITAGGGLRGQGGGISMKAFEAIAASNILIADKLLPFLEETFGNNILFIDTINKTADDIFHQIQQHVQWIRDHPQDATTKARECHRIYSERFTNEICLNKLQDLYEEIIQVRRGQN